jgi:GGDEF domain-containing protein
LTKPFDMQELLLRVRNALRRASYASLVSPVTGLPSQEVIESTLEKLMDEAGWAVIYVSIANIEPFSEAYGFVARDDVLRAVSLIITDVADEVGTNDDFVGHVNKANFVVVTREAKAPTMRDALATRLEKAFNYFYPVKDIERGTVTAPMRAEVGIVTPASGPYSAPNAILNAAMDARRTVATSHIA